MDQDQCYGRAVRQAHSKLLINAESFDIDVTVGGKPFRCHKLLLTLWSGYFDTLLQGEWKDSQGPVNLEEDENVSAESFEVLRDWIYKGILNLSVDNVYDILACAHYLQITSALDVCVIYIEQMYENEQVKVSDMVKMVSLAERYGLLRLQEVTFKFLLLNFEAITSTPDFLEHMTFDLLEALLKRDDLVCSKEDVIFNAAVGWFRHKEERLKSVDDIVIHLRLGLIAVSTVVDAMDFMLMSNIKTPETFNMVQAAMLRESDARKLTYLKDNHANVFKPRKTHTPNIPKYPTNPPPTSTKTVKDESTQTDKNIADNDPRAEVTEAAFSFTVNNIRGLKDKVYSTHCYIRNLPWRIMVIPTLKNKAKYLGFYLDCDAQSTSWSCHVSFELKLLNQNTDGNMSMKFTQTFTNKDNGWGSDEFISWGALLNPQCGFISASGAITLQVHVVADQPTGL